MNKPRTRTISLVPSGADKARLTRRYRKERLFRASGIGALVLAFVFLIFLLGSITGRGISAFSETLVRLDITFDPEILGVVAPLKPGSLDDADFDGIVRQSLKARFPGTEDHSQLVQLYNLVSKNAGYTLHDTLAAHPEFLGTTQRVWLHASSDIDMLVKGHIDRHLPPEMRKVTDQQIAWVDALTASHDLKRSFNRVFFKEGDSREPEQAGVLGGIIGSLLTMLVCMAVAFPVGVITAVYLEEFAGENRWTDILEVNINNLAAVPSIIYGLLGLAVFLNFFGLPRGSSVVGGLTLALLVLPVIIIATRNSLKTVPPSIRQGAMALGASPVQVVWHHVLPLSLPGIMTGTILGLARAVGETAPLLMIGMVAFVADLPTGFTSPASVMPVQIYLWADSPEIGFQEKTCAAILVLLVFLIAANAVAAGIRRKFERKW
jgi:phosphate transport system permease protein